MCFSSQPMKHRRFSDVSHEELWNSQLLSILVSNISSKESWGRDSYIHQGIWLYKTSLVTHLTKEEVLSLSEFTATLVTWQHNSLFVSLSHLFYLWYYLYWSCLLSSGEPVLCPDAFLLLSSVRRTGNDISGQYTEGMYNSFKKSWCQKYFKNHVKWFTQEKSEPIQNALKIKYLTATIIYRANMAHNVIIKIIVRNKIY